MKTAAIVLYVIQALAIICAIITGQEFINFSSGPCSKPLGSFSLLSWASSSIWLRTTRSRKQSNLPPRAQTQTAQPLQPLQHRKPKPLPPLQPKPLRHHGKPRRLQRRKKPQRRTRKPLRPQQRSNLLSIRPFSTALSAEQGKTPKTLSASLADRRSDNRSSGADSYSHPDKHASSRKMR